MRLLLVLLLIALPIEKSISDEFLSQNICNLEFETLWTHRKQIKTQMLVNEINLLIQEMRKSTDLECLIDREISEINSDKRRKYPDQENCELLPKVFYADAEGRTLYRMSVRAKKRAEDILDQDLGVPDCLDPLLN